MYLQLYIRKWLLDASAAVGKLLLLLLHTRALVRMNLISMTRDTSNQPHHNMRCPTTKEVRELIVYQTEKLGWTTAQVATALNITSRTVQRVKKLNSEIGDVTMDPSVIGKAKILSLQHIDVCLITSPSPYAADSS